MSASVFDNKFYFNNEDFFTLNGRLNAMCMRFVVAQLHQYLFVDWILYARVNIMRGLIRYFLSR